MTDFKISVTGCALGDFVYNKTDFSSIFFKKYQSIIPGDGGLEPGKLVFTKELERFAEKKFTEILRDIVGKRSYDTFSIGGPAIVSTINAAQLLFDTSAEVNFYGARANDEKGRAITKLLFKLLSKLSVNLDNYHILKGDTPYTDVLSDPDFSEGKGERIFVNNIGCAGQFHSSFLDEKFWNSDMIVFGATALVPQLHEELTGLLSVAKAKGAFTLVHTVYDFPNEKRNPESPWPLGDTIQSLPLIDLLVMDNEEALRISGTTSMEAACNFFKQNGSAAFMITHGAKPTHIYSSGKVFAQTETIIPVCSWISNDFLENPHLKGDTTGCGDNFVGAVISSVVNQLMNRRNFLSLNDAAILGTVSGGFCCYHLGGTYFENYPGEKLEKTKVMLRKYYSEN